MRKRYYKVCILRSFLNLSGKLLRESPSTPIDSSEISMDVKTAMAQLNETERTVVTLFYINDMPIKQIAAITGINQSTLRSHLHRAKEKMAKTLKQE